MSESTREQKAHAARVRMAELAARFLERTQGDLATMREALSKVRAGDAKALGEIRNLAHRMVGTGATLGFEAISARASRVEQLIESIPVGTSPPAALLADLGSALEALETDFRKLRPN